MTLYLTDRTTEADVMAAKASGIVHGIKLYPAGATTHSDAGVTDLGKLHATLAAMQSCGLPFLVHGEVTDPAIDIFDREAVFIDRVLQPLRRDFPALKIVFEHATTREAVQWVRESPGPVAATLTPQHLLYDRNALFVGGIRPHCIACRCSSVRFIVKRCWRPLRLATRSSFWALTALLMHGALRSTPVGAQAVTQHPMRWSFTPVLLIRWGHSIALKHLPRTMALIFMVFRAIAVR